MLSNIFCFKSSIKLGPDGKARYNYTKASDSNLQRGRRIKSPMGTLLLTGILLSFAKQIKYQVLKQLSDIVLSVLEPGSDYRAIEHALPLIAIQLSVNDSIEHEQCTSTRQDQTSDQYRSMTIPLQRSSREGCTRSTKTQNILFSILIPIKILKHSV